MDVNAEESERSFADWRPSRRAMFGASVAGVLAAGVPAVASASPAPPEWKGAKVYDVTHAPFSAAGNGKADDRKAIQAAIDAAAEAGGGVVFLPPGRYRVSRVPGAEPDSWHALAVRTGVTFAGSGRAATEIFYDDTVNPVPVPGTTKAMNPRVVVISIGTWKTAAHDVVVRDLRVTGNNQAIPFTIGGGKYSVIGIASRLDIVGTPDLQPSDVQHITIENCNVVDVALGIGCNPRATVKDGDPKQPPSLPNDWKVLGCYVTNCTNKAIELFALNTLITENFCYDVYDGPQIIGSTSRRCIIRNNIVFYGETGISVTEGASDVLVEGNVLVGLAEHPYPGAPKGTSSLGANSLGALTIRREPVSAALTFSNIKVVANRIDASATTSKRAFGLHRHDYGSGCAYDAILFADNTVDGDVYAYDWGNPSASSGKRHVYRNNQIEGRLLTTGYFSCPYMRLTGNNIDSSARHVINTDRGMWRDNVVNTGAAGTLISNTSNGNSRNLVTGNYFSGSLTNQGGAENRVVDNSVAGGAWS